MMEALILMTRIPIAGKTKTRLMEIFSGEECAEIHMNFLKDLFYVCEKLKDKIDIYLTYTPEGSLSLIEDIIPSYVKTFPQRGETLGDRMGNAINNLLCENYNKVVLIGSDIPQLQPRDIEEAFNVLEEKNICLGPTSDGGYYLVGMKKFQSEIFCNNIVWGEKSVLEGTMDIANRLNLSVGLASKYMDIDTKEDVFNFMKNIDKESYKYEIFPHNTAAFLKKHKERICYTDSKVNKYRGEKVVEL